MDLTLTGAGRRRVKSLQAGESPSGRVLGILHSHGSLTVNEIAELANLPVGEVKSTARKLRKQGLLRVEGE